MIINIILSIIILILFITLIILFKKYKKTDFLLEEQINENLSNVNTLNISNISLKDTMDDLDYIIKFYVDNFIVMHKITDKDKFINNNLFEKYVSDLTTDIIISLSEDFKKKIYLFITNDALLDRINKIVLQNITVYSSEINNIKI